MGQAPSLRRPPRPPDEIPVLFARPNDWIAWLHRHHKTSSGIWLRLSKKGSPLQSVSYDEALEAALCYGWIDAQKRPESGLAWLQRFTPRKAKSIWSKINRQKALALIEAGRMQPAGLEQVERAKQDGRWESAYDSPSTAAIPDDLQAALDRNPRAKAFFATLDSANRYAVLWRVQTAKRAATRAQRIGKFVDMLAKHQVASLALHRGAGNHARSRLSAGSPASEARAWTLAFSRSGIHISTACPREIREYALCGMAILSPGTWVARS